jgi:malonate transporter and related proteins
MVKVLVDALIPIFAGLLLGYLAGLRGVLDNQNVRTLTTFVMSFAVPCALFLSISRTPRLALREQIGAAFVLAIVYFVLYALTFYWARVRQKLVLSDSSVVALTVSFPNAAGVGLALLADVFGGKALVTVATAIALGSMTISVVTLAILEAEKGHSGVRFSFRQIALCLFRTAKRPIVWAPALGLVFSFANLHLPSYLDRSLAVMGSAAGGSALVLTGLVVSAQKFEFAGNILVITLLKNGLQPVLALAAAMLLHLSIEQTRYVTLISAIPCGFFGIVFGKSFESTPKLAGSGLIASYTASIATLAMWIVIVNHLG